MIKSKNYHRTANKRKTGKHFVFIFLIGTAFSQSFAQYEIKKYTINSGGAQLSGGSFQLQSSIGQVDASNTQIGGDFSLSSGFWQENNDLIFKNGFE